MKETNIPPPPPNAPGPFSLSDEKLLREYFIQSGFKDVIIERQDMIFNFKTAEEFTDFVCETASPIQVILSKQSDERRKEILQAITEEVADKYIDKNSNLTSFRNEVICVCGSK